MYGGNNKSLQQIANEVKETVLGQNETVDKLGSFSSMVCSRAKLINEGYEDSLALPPLSSALIVGPTASGKSHMLKTFAKKSGMIFRQIDASSMSAEGYKGASFSTEWAELAQELEEDPGKMALVLIDEIDKPLCQNHEGNIKFDLLKPLEGGMLTGHAGRYENPFMLNCDRCIFILAGAFTGIEAIVADRLRNGKSGCGFSSSCMDLPADAAEREKVLRDKMTLEDIEAWGCPRELMGRISQVWPMSALGEETLRNIVVNNKQAEYGRMLNGAELEIEKSAVDLIVKRALEHNYGARSVNQQIASVFVEKIWPEVSGRRDLDKVTLFAANGDLDFAASYDNKKEALLAADARLSEKSGYALLDEVHARCLKTTGDTPCAPTFEAGATDFATLLLQRGDHIIVDNDKLSVDDDFSLAEITLLNALYAYLCDWLPKSDFTTRSIGVLLTMWSDRSKAKHCPLDLLFKQVSTGMRYNPSESKWECSKYVRNSDGVKPGKLGGLAPDEDKALGYYTEFCEYPVKCQKEAVHSLAYRLLSLEA